MQQLRSWQGWKSSKTVGELKSKAEYSALRKLYRSTKTKKYHAKLLSDMKSRLLYVVDEAYFPSPAQRKEIKNIINGMSVDELVTFSYDNSMLIRDVYLAYTENKEVSLADADQYETDLDLFMTALRKYKKG